MKFQFPDSSSDEEDNDYTYDGKGMIKTNILPSPRSFHKWEPKGALSQKEFDKQNKARRTEGLFEHKLINMRQSPLPLEFLVPKQGKKLMSTKDARALQSKINLKYPKTNLMGVDKPKKF